MANHYCLDPFDSYAQDEVLVIFEGTYPHIRLLSVIDKNKNDILSALVDEQRHDLVREIAAFHRPGVGDADVVASAGVLAG
ncbi:hypothetical protein [Methylobacterium sp. 77]|uniref:hypothetical protein n=1 Tax=Methylobacterium sp. 77 TaxID=1101192 RepID=UPI00036B7CC0|nr:hypothetical protein [Methylobacterium sp. 77]